MSTGGSARDSRFDMTWRHFFIISGVLGVIAYFLHYSKEQSALADLSSTHRSTTLDPAIANRENEVISQRAVNRDNVAVLLARATMARDRLKTLKKQQAAWTAKEVSFMKGTPGRRIAASAGHLELVTDLLGQERATAEDLLRWEMELEALSAPIEAAWKNKSVDIAITSEHSQRMTDLGQDLVKAVAEFERLNLLIEAVTQETQTIAPAPVTLVQIHRERKLHSERAFAERMAKSRAAARQQAEEDQIDRVSKLERELIEAETKRQEEVLAAKKLQIEQLAEQEKASIFDETPFKQYAYRADFSGLNKPANPIQAEVQRARIESEFNRDLPTIRAHLSAFISPGCKHRSDGTKGPMSLSFLASSGALVHDTAGMEKLLQFATNHNDRPCGALSAHSSATDRRVETAQELLRKYGELLVAKGMLDQ
jgi:hypothetical protein